MAIQNAKNSQIVRGDNLWLFIATSATGTTTPLPIAFATNCSLNMNTAMNSISSKYHGSSSFSTPGEGTWTASTEALYAVNSETGPSARTGDASFKELVAAKKENKPLKVKVGYVADAGSNIVDETGSFDWQISEGWSGEAYITSLQASGSHGDAATWSVELQGNGDLTEI